MSARTWIMLGLSLVCGLGAAVGVQAMRGRGRAVETRAVVFAAADIQRGETIQEASVEIRQLPKDQAPENGLAKAADVVGRVAFLPMLKGDLVTDPKLAPKGSGSGMAALIKPGMRAFTIQTANLSSSMAGFLLPGNRVDVLLTVTSQKADDETGGAATTTLLQNVELLAVHTTVDTPSANRIDPEQARSVTLMVTREQAELLDLGQSKGTLHLALRNPKDSEAGPSRPATTVVDLPLPRSQKPKPAEAAPKPEKAAPPPPPVPVYEDVVLTTRTLRGTSVSTHRMTVRVVRPRGAPSPPAGDSPAAAPESLALEESATPPR